MDKFYQANLSSNAKLTETPATVTRQNIVKDQCALITPAPELRIRAAIPEPQNQLDCQQASQSADQAIRQASQLASDSIRQASQQASQSADAASRSASDGIRQAQQSASQSIAAASRSVSSAISSASSAVASVQSSAEDAISRANGAQSSAEQSASTAQVEESKAVLQAGAAVAAATGKAAAAGSSFLAAAAEATESAEASVSVLGSAASSQIAQANNQVTASQTTAITATQTAIAIVGSIIASALITILIFFLIMRHRRKKSKQRSGGRASSTTFSPSAPYPSEPKAPVSAIMSSTAVASQGALTTSRTLDPGRPSTASLSLFHQPTPRRSGSTRTTFVPWNPSQPPNPPTLGSWLNVQDMSPFGPIRLPIEHGKSKPLGGQLKSPLRSKPAIPQSLSFNVPILSPKILNLSYRTAAPASNTSPPTSELTRRPSLEHNALSPSRTPGESHNQNAPANNRDPPSAYRESQTSIWTDGLSSSNLATSPIPQTINYSKLNTTTEPAAPSKPGQEMQLPSPKAPVRTTAEWLLDQRNPNAHPNLDPRVRGSDGKYERPSFLLGSGRGLPRNPRLDMRGMPRPGPERERERERERGVWSIKAVFDGGDSGGLLLRSEYRGSAASEGERSAQSRSSTPGVGKAL